MGCTTRIFMETILFQKINNFRSYYYQHCKSAPTIISLYLAGWCTGGQSSSATRETNLLLTPGLSFWFLVPFGPSLCKSPHCTIGQRCKYPVPGRLFGRSREAIAGYPSMKNAPLRRDRAQPVPYPGEKLEALSHQRRLRRKINGGERLNRKEQH